MYRFVLCMCLALALLAGFVAPAIATQGTVNGVLVQERVVNLPQDQSKWYVSVVGAAGESRYQEVLQWFDTNANLKHLKDQVHFNPVPSDSLIYRERYAPNVKGLPTVRVQNHQGVVIYEAAANAIPMTADGLYGAIANDVQVAQGIRPVLPWRREMERRNNTPCPCPTPQPDPEPQPIAPIPPAPPGPPDMGTPTQSILPAWWLMLSAVGAGCGLGVAQMWRETYQKE
jgi:hypothetical protein